MGPFHVVSGSNVSSTSSEPAQTRRWLHSATWTHPAAANFLWTNSNGSLARWTRTVKVIFQKAYFHTNTILTSLLRSIHVQNCSFCTSWRCAVRDTSKTVKILNLGPYRRHLVNGSQHAAQISTSTNWMAPCRSWFLLSSICCVAVVNCRSIHLYLLVYCCFCICQIQYSNTVYYCS